MGSNRSISDKKIFLDMTYIGVIWCEELIARTSEARKRFHLVFVKMSIFQQCLLARLSEIWNPPPPKSIFSKKTRWNRRFRASGVRAIDSSHQITPIRPYREKIFCRSYYLDLLKGGGYKLWTISWKFFSKMIIFRAIS